MNILNLLVIEDYPPDVVLLKAYLEEASFRHNFFHSSTLQEGFEILRENKIDLVLLDLSLADSAGFNTLKKYLEESPDVPVIVMTGLKNEVVGTQSVRAGAQDYLIKGNFDSKNLVQRLRYSLERWKNNSRLQKEADELKENEQRSRATFDLVKIGSWEMDIVGRSMKWNEGMYKIFGFQPNSLSPTLSDYMNYVHFEDRSKVDTFFDKVIQGSPEPRLEHRIIVNGTNIRYLAINARVNIKGDMDKIMLIGTVQDITDRRNRLNRQDKEEKQELEADFFRTSGPRSATRTFSECLLLVQHPATQRTQSAQQNLEGRDQDNGAQLLSTAAICPFPQFGTEIQAGPGAAGRDDQNHAGFCL